MSNREEKKKYLQEKVNPVVQKMIVDLLVESPENVLEYIKDWADKKLSQSLEPKITISRKVSGITESDEDDSFEDTADMLTTEEFLAKVPKKTARASVSAEAYGKFNQKSAFQPKVIPKSQEQKDRIKQRLSQAFMFSALEDKEQEVIIDAMEEVSYKAEDFVIRQGDSGDHLYVVDEGKLVCTKKFSGNNEPTFLKNYEPGESFGELALLYNAPRAANIQALEDCVLFALDRETFNHIVKDAAIRKREHYENFLSNLEILTNMDDYERSKIADAAKRVRVSAGEYVVKQGEEGDVFYFIEEGEAYATKVVNPGEEPKEVYQYGPGGYFGELALLKNVPRQANVIAKTDLTLVSLDRMSFKRLLGPLEEILQRNFKNYEKFNA